jgi:hypothetical protein
MSMELRNMNITGLLQTKDEREKPLLAIFKHPLLAEIIAHDN